MIKLANETPIALSKVPAHRLLATRPVSFNTVYRWATVGFRGVQLETIRLGGVTATTEEALIRFFAALTLTDAARRQIRETRRMAGATAG